MIYCSYGCGQEATYQFKNGKYCCSKHVTGCLQFIKNNSGYTGRHHSEETKKKIGEFCTHKKLKREKPELCDYGCGQKSMFYFKTPDKWCCSKDVESCPSQRKSRSKSKLEFYSNFENRKKQSTLMKKSHNTTKAIKNHSNAAVKYFSIPGNKEKHSEMLRKPEIRKNYSEAAKRLWKKPEYIKKLQIALDLKPNKPETLILNLLDEMFPNEWKYTGDYSFWVNGKNPDFTNINGQKKLIEFFGDHWHKGENPEDRKNIFKECGYETLVIWEHELKNIENVKIKIQNFIIGIL
jgi:hypothetical protein